MLIRHEAKGIYIYLHLFFISIYIYLDMQRYGHSMLDIGKYKRKNTPQTSVYMPKQKAEII